VRLFPKKKIFFFFSFPPPQKKGPGGCGAISVSEEIGQKCIGVLIRFRHVNTWAVFPVSDVGKSLEAL